MIGEGGAGVVGDFGPDLVVAIGGELGAEEPGGQIEERGVGQQVVDGAVEQVALAPVARKGRAARAQRSAKGASV